MDGGRRRAIQGLFLLTLVTIFPAACGLRGREAPAEGSGRRAAAGGEVVVFAAASLADAFTELAPLFARAHGGARVTLNFAGSQQLRTQLAQGARADVFASADEPNMEEAVRAGLVEPPVPFARNRLVLVVPADNPAGIEGLGDLTRKHRLVLGVPEAPFGRYARQVLARAEGVYGPGFAQAVLANVVSQEATVRQSLAKVALGEADAGFCYRSDVTGAVASRVRVLEIPEELNVVVTYRVSAVKGAPHPDLARAWVAFLRSPAAREVLRRHGLEPF